MEFLHEAAICNNFSVNFLYKDDDGNQFGDEDDDEDIEDLE